MNVNMGCGDKPTPGWVNIDNSPTVLIANTPFRALLGGRSAFARVARQAGIRYGNAFRTGFPASSVAVLYACHLLEHFDREDAGRFLSEARRVLEPGGILRLCVPDLRRYVDDYLKTGDADGFMARTQIAAARPRTLRAWLRAAIRPVRRHNWIYDRDSLGRLLDAAGFVAITGLASGETAIPNPGALDLSERADGSIYVECRNPPEAGPPPAMVGADGLEPPTLSV
jgi:SAM-dependent methyltransferase